MMGPRLSLYSSDAVSCSVHQGGKQHHGMTEEKGDKSRKIFTFLTYVSIINNICIT